ncbi:hypothetical protein QN277_007264 [Acacia crassicarpa]|uniref:Defensin-like protein n=1 Tax=Acacia crassicarpa TaxID=499986 RepID=A0AAE1M8N4_9FABA|nr:hypothetical protein QN277_007264 [Acacia crassicarpa]
MVTGEKCHEDLGVCDADCFARCKAAHPNGQGSCVGAPICRCLFNECKTCTEVLGQVGTCVLDRCKSACSAKHPNRKSEGSCYGAGGQAGYNCLCDYDCW